MKFLCLVPSSDPLSYCLCLKSDLYFPLDLSFTYEDDILVNVMFIIQSTV